ncbi:MAG: anthranilate phosphoribosyltransferase [Verrucomicrobia bacterium]|nr:anthranilate phosphoribosyltransferase [Verrucomicrobiota bacterium]
MSALLELTQRLKARIDLSTADVALATHELSSPQTVDAEKIDFLSALEEKGTIAAEITAFAKEFRALSIDPGVAQWSAQAIDIVGTGGDHAGGFNISSLVVFTLASAGVTVMKHGNRGITSKCGSADLLAALGVDLEAKPEKLQAALRELGFAFFFAPAYHPAFKHIGPARKALAAVGQRTIFNILGPLINPGRPAHILLGVSAEKWVSRLADALELLGTGSGLAVHGVLGANHGIDELTTATANRVRGIGRLRSVDGVWRASEHGLTEGSFEDLKGGDLATNLAITEAVVAGKGPAALVETIVFNAAVALWICGRTASVRDGTAQARELLLGGSVKRKIAATKEFFKA